MSVYNQTRCTCKIWVSTYYLLIDFLIYYKVLSLIYKVCCCDSRLITGFETRLTWRVPLVEQELLTLLEHMSSPPVFCGVRVTRSLVLYVCFVDRCLSLCTFSFGHCVVWSSSIYGFWLFLWYLQNPLIINRATNKINNYWMYGWNRSISCSCNNIFFVPFLLYVFQRIQSFFPRNYHIYSIFFLWYC